MKPIKSDVILKGESIYSYLIKVPYRRIFYVNEIIENEFKTRFIDISYILYDYRILRFTRRYIEVRVYSINGKDTLLFSEEVKEKRRLRLGRVIPEQLEFVSRIKKHIDSSPCIILNRSEDFIYFSFIVKKKIIMSKAVKENSETYNEVIKREMENFMNMSNEISTLYFEKEIFEKYNNIFGNLVDRNEIKFLP